MFVDFNILNQLGSPSINSNTFANRPAAGQTGRLFVSIDTFEIYRDNGTTWDLIGGPGSSTVTGTGAATQVAYWTAAQAIGGSNNLWWDNTSGFLGVGSNVPSARIEAVKTDGIGIYANYTTNAGSGSSATAIWAKNVTNSSGYGAVIEETTPNATAGQYPLLIKHSLSSGTAGVGMGTGVHWQLPDDAGTFKTTQLTVETIDAAAATYKTRYRFNVQNNGSSLPVAYINSTGLGIFTATPGAALDIHSTGIMVQLNSTSATANSLLAFQRSGSGLWRIGDQYNAGNNFFELHNTVLTNNAIQVLASSNEATFLSSKTYSSGNAIGVAVQHNLTIPNAVNVGLAAIGGVNSNLNLTLGGSTTVANTGRQGLEGSTTINFTGAGTLTMTQGSTVRAFSALSSVYAFNGSAVGTITHLAGLRICFPDNVGSAVNITNNYALLINNQTTGTGTVTYTNRWGIYQEGASDLNYMAANLLLGSTVNTGDKLQVTGNGNVTGTFTATTLTDNFITINAAQINRTGGNVELQFNGAAGVRIFGGTSYPSVFESGTGRLGVATSGPIGQLHVQGVGNGQSIRTDHTSSYSFLYSTISNGSAIAFDNLAGALATYTGGAERLRIDTAGLIGVNTGTPQVQLDVRGASVNTFAATIGTGLSVGNWSGLSFGYAEANNFLYRKSALVFERTGASAEGNIHILLNNAPDTSSATLSNSVVKIANNGNFLIGTTTDAGQKLQVNGVVKASALELGEQYSNSYTTDATWTTAQVIIPTNTLQIDAVYLVKVKWTNNGGGSPYEMNSAFLIVPAVTNGSGDDNIVTPIISTHQGGTATFSVNMYAAASAVAAGLKLATSALSAPNGTLIVTATKLKN